MPIPKNNTGGSQRTVSSKIEILGFVRAPIRFSEAFENCVCVTKISFMWARVNRSSTPSSSINVSCKCKWASLGKSRSRGNRRLSSSDPAKYRFHKLGSAASVAKSSFDAPVFSKLNISSDRI